MTYRKTWFDYVLWAVYAGLCVALLAFVGNHMYAFYVGVSLAKLGTFLLFPVLFCIYPAIRLSAQAIRKRHCFSAHFSAMAEALMVSVSFVFGTILRVKEGFLMADIYETAQDFPLGDYYEMAVVRAGEGSISLAHGMSDLFVRCLRVVFSFLGNSAAAALLFQVCIQVIAMFFAYLAVRKAAGRFASCTVLLLMAFSDAFINKIDVIDPECLLIALFLAGLYLVISYVKASLAGRDVCGGLPGIFLLGAVLGLLCYLEVGCVILLLFLAGLFTGKSGADVKRKRKIGSLLMVIAGIGAGFLGAVAEDAALSGVIFYQGLMGWIRTWLYPGMGARMFGVIGTEYPFFVLLFLLASFVVFEFIREGREQNFSLWFLPCILVTPVFLMDFSVVGFGGVALFFWTVMAGLGLKGAVLGGQALLVKEKIEEINGSASEPAAPPQEKPRFIENPLPLPKKHVKREMDYDYQIPEEDMHYDVDVAEKDDFDRYNGIDF